jgi:hypothetical protein
MKNLILMILFFSYHILLAQPYEGDIGGNPVWFDLTLPERDGQVQGAYFYKKIFVNIPLTGTKIGQTINLTEMGKKGEITGHITLTYAKDSMSGTWKDPKGNNDYGITLFRSEEMYKPRHKFDPGKPEPPGESDDFYKCESGRSILFCRKNIVSYQDWWTCEGGNYPLGGSSYYILCIDNENAFRSGIYSEIDSNMLPVFNEMIHDRIQQCMYETRSKESDSIWIKILSDRIDPESGNKVLDTIFTWTDAKMEEVQKDFYVDNSGVRMNFYEYFHFPHVCAALDLFCTIELSFSDLDKYLSKNSVLRRFIQKSK